MSFPRRTLDSPSSEELSLAAHSDLPPLAFDSARQLTELIARLRDGLRERCQKLQTQSNIDVARVEEIVLQQFFDQVAPVLCSNTRIASDAFTEKDNEVVETEPFSEELNDRVLRYQSKLYAVRTENVMQRREVGIETRKLVEQQLDANATKLEEIERKNAQPAPHINLPDSAEELDGILTYEEEVELMSQSKESIQDLVKELSGLVQKSEQALAATTHSLTVTA